MNTQCFLPVFYSNFNYWFNKFHNTVFLYISYYFHDGSAIRKTIGNPSLFYYAWIWDVQWLIWASFLLIIMQKIVCRYRRRQHRALDIFTNFWLNCFPEIHRLELPGGMGSSQRGKQGLYKTFNVQRVRKIISRKDDGYLKCTCN